MFPGGDPLSLKTICRVPAPLSDLNSRMLESTGTPARQEDTTNMNRNLLYLVIGALAVVAVILGYWLYEERQSTGGVEIEIGEGGVSIEQK